MFAVMHFLVNVVACTTILTIKEHVSVSYALMIIENNKVEDL